MRKNIILFLILFNFVAQNVSARDYNFDVYGLNIRFMKVQFSTQSNNTIATEIESQSLLAFFSYFKGVGITKNTKDQFTYNFSYDKIKKKRSTTIVFKNNKVTENFSVPAKEIKKNIVPVQKQDLENVVDPLTAIQLLVFNQKNNLNCNKQQKVFDGTNVFYLKLSQENSDGYVIDSSKLSYQGSLQKCKLSYVIVSGHEVEDEKKLNKMYVDIFFGKQNKMFLPYFLTTKSKITLEMFLN